MNNDPTRPERSSRRGEASEKRWSLENTIAQALYRAPEQSDWPFEDHCAGLGSFVAGRLREAGFVFEEDADGGLLTKVRTDLQSLRQVHEAKLVECEQLRVAAQAAADTLLKDAMLLHHAHHYVTAARARSTAGVLRAALASVSATDTKDQTDE
jgi:hypothetical protein